MFELWSLAEQNPILAGWIIGGTVFAIGSIWAIVYGIRNPESDYVAGLEFESVPRTIFLVFCSFILGGISFNGWNNIGLVILALMIIGATWTMIRGYLEYREAKRNQRTWHYLSR